MGEFKRFIYLPKVTFILDLSASAHAAGFSNGPTSACSLHLQDSELISRPLGCKTDMGSILQVKDEICHSTLIENSLDTLDLQLTESFDLFFKNV